jgi:hypothetical protein
MQVGRILREGLGIQIGDRGGRVADEAKVAGVSGAFRVVHRPVVKHLERHRRFQRDELVGRIAEFAHAARLENTTNQVGRPDARPRLRTHQVGQRVLNPGDQRHVAGNVGKLIAQVVEAEHDGRVVPRDGIGDQVGGELFVVGFLDEQVRLETLPAQGGQRVAGGVLEHGRVARGHRQHRPGGLQPPGNLGQRALRRARAQIGANHVGRRATGCFRGGDCRFQSGDHVRGLGKIEQHLRQCPARMLGQGLLEALDRIRADKPVQAGFFQQVREIRDVQSSRQQGRIGFQNVQRLAVIQKQPGGSLRDGGNCFPSAQTYQRASGQGAPGRQLDRGVELGGGKWRQPGAQGARRAARDQRRAVFRAIKMQVAQQAFAARQIVRKIGLGSAQGGEVAREGVAQFAPGHAAVGQLGQRLPPFIDVFRRWAGLRMQGEQFARGSAETLFDERLQRERSQFGRVVDVGEGCVGQTNEPERSSRGANGVQLAGEFSEIHGAPRLGTRALGSFRVSAEAGTEVERNGGAWIFTLASLAIRV